MTPSSNRVPEVELHQRALAGFMTRARGGEVTDGPEMLLYVGGSDVSWTNGVQMAMLRDDDADARIGEVVETFRSRGISATWWVGPTSRPVDLAVRLERAGFHLEEELPWMTVPLDGAVTAPEVPGLHIERVADAAAQRDFVGVMQAGFGFPSTVRRELIQSGDAAGYGRDAGWVRFIGTVRGRPVASSGLMHFADIAGVYNVTTIPRYRRRGIGAAMTIAAMEHGRSLGYRRAALGTSPMARRMYEGLGFREACVLRAYVWRP
jgi:GNAT superfamily N-acetyltransferase